MSAASKLGADHSEDSVQIWAAVATATPRVARREALRRAFFVALALPGLIWLLAMGWTVRFIFPSVLALAGVHLVALFAASAPLFILKSTNESPESILRRVIRRYGTRHDRLRLLRRVVVVEVLVLFLEAPARAIATGSVLAWGSAFTVAVLALSVIWPLERAAAAQRDEGQRLADLDHRVLYRGPPG